LAVRGLGPNFLETIAFGSDLFSGDYERAAACWLGQSMGQGLEADSWKPQGQKVDFSMTWVCKKIDTKMMARELIYEKR
jgi:hypothetical protein